MANHDASERNLVRLPQTGGEIAQPSLEAGMGIMLGGTKQLDLSGLTEAQRQTLQFKNADGLISVNKKAQELVADAGAFNHTLGTMAHHTNEVAAAGQNVTITHTQETSLGRTEIIMGTSEAAKQGKLSRTQTGGVDHANLHVGLALIAVFVVAIVIIVMGR